MKKFVIHYNYYATIDVEVLAENEEEAKAKADQITPDPGDFDFTLNEQTVIDQMDGIDLPALTDQLRSRVKEYIERHQSAFMPIHFHLTAEVDSEWNGKAYVPIRDNVISLSLDATGEEVLVSFEDSERMALDDLSDIDQYSIAVTVLR